MRGLNSTKPRRAGLLALVLGAVALLAIAGVAVAKDHGGHGRHDHHHNRLPQNGAGTVSSFDAATGKLTIALTSGGSASALVTKETEIRCEEFEGNRLQRRDHGGSGNSGSDDNEINGNDDNDFDDNGGEMPVTGPSGPPAEVPKGGGPTCTTALLVPGATVGEAEVHTEHGVLIFEKVDLT